MLNHHERNQPKIYVKINDLVEELGTGKTQPNILSHQMGQYLKVVEKIYPFLE